jgi:hypothetical protein
MIELFVEWYFFEIPLKIKKIWGNYVWFFGKYFALGELTRDLFAPWKGQTFKREKRGFELGDMLSAVTGNLISRVLGAIVRLGFIAAGLLAELAAGLCCLAAFLMWIGVVPLIFFCLWRGAYLLLIS